jgi:kynureninase
MDTVALIASLQVFQQTDMATIQLVSRRLTGYLEYLLLRIDDRPFGIIVSDPAERGAQLALKFHSRDFLDRLMGPLRAKGIVVAQKGDVMRVAPVALYNTFLEVWTFVEELRQAIAAQSK